MSSRKDKFPETLTFHYHNANPHNRITGDCAFRAISTGLNQDYNKTVMEMAEMMCKTGYALNDSKGESRYLESKGWEKKKQCKKPDGKKYTGSEFCKFLAKQRQIGCFDRDRIIAHIGGHHIVAICWVEKAGTYKVYDTWNSTSGCIGNWWIERA